MGDMFDYLRWRGDILFSQVAPNPVDALIFSALSYFRYEGIVSETPGEEMSLSEAAQRIQNLPSMDGRFRVPADWQLLKAAAETLRFGRTQISFYRSMFIPEEETQFAAVSFRLDDGSAFLAFRGTDRTLVGWKEDFNMSFCQSVPAQREAVRYVQDFAAAVDVPLRLGGHSKGGNLAVYAGAKCTMPLQERILEVYNQDGPGFTEYLMGDPGYLRLVPRIRTYVPQSSVIGMLMDHEEPYTVIKSNQIGLLQHDPYSWEVLGGNFVLLEERTADSRFMDRTFKNWLAGMTNEERSEFFDTLFDLLSAGDASHTNEIMQPKNVWAYLKTLQGDEAMRRRLSTELVNLIQAARQAERETDQIWDYTDIP